MKSLLIKRTIVLAGAKTSISIEEEFWTGLKEIAEHRNMKLSEIMLEIDSERRTNNLSSATRVFILRYFRTKN
jgi:predicted DNA-binding ribbon-helix-helix protein